MKFRFLFVRVRYGSEIDELVSEPITPTEAEQMQEELNDNLKFSGWNVDKWVLCDLVGEPVAAEVDD